MAYPLVQMVITVSAPEVLNGNEGRRELAAFYGDLLGMQVVGEGWLRIGTGRVDPLSLALEGDGWSDLRPPSSKPTPLRPGLASSGSPLTASAPGRWLRFYEGLFGVGNRLEDSADRVVLDLEDDRFPSLAFQHAQFVAARWPDPEYPAQLHLDLRFADGRAAASARAEQLGAVRLPELADTEIFADPAAHPFWPGRVSATIDGDAGPIADRVPYLRGRAGVMFRPWKASNTRRDSA